VDIGSNWKRNSSHLTAKPTAYERSPMCNSISYGTEEFSISLKILSLVPNESVSNHVKNAKYNYLPHQPYMSSHSPTPLSPKARKLIPFGPASTCAEVNEYSGLQAFGYP
jgi:hypothetical protein